jgi:hypothetical protein
MHVEGEDGLAAKLFSQIFPKKWRFSPNFSKDFLVAFVCFQGVTRRKKHLIEFGVFSKFLRLPIRRAGLRQNGIPHRKRSQNEAKRNEIVSPAKSRVLLSL